MSEGLLYLGLTLVSCLETLSVLSNLKLIENFLNSTIHEDRKVVHCVVDTVIGNA